MQQALGDHGEDTVAVGRGSAVEQSGEAQLAASLEDEFDMAVRAGADDGEGLVGADERFVLEQLAEAATLAGGQEERLARVRLRTLGPSRQPSRRRTAGGELRLGTTSTYMGTS